MKPETIRWILGGLCAALFYLYMQVNLVQQDEAANTVMNEVQDQMLKDLRKDLKDVHHEISLSYESN